MKAQSEVGKKAFHKKEAVGSAKIPRPKLPPSPPIPMQRAAFPAQPVGNSVAARLGTSGGQCAVQVPGECWQLFRVLRPGLGYQFVVTFRRVSDFPIMGRC